MQWRGMRWTRTWWISIAIVLAGCREDATRREPAPAPAAETVTAAVEAAVAAALAQDAAAAAGGGGMIRFSVKDPVPADVPRNAVRCRLAGDPLDVECSRGPAVAVDGKGRVYAADKATVRRYDMVAAGADGCELARDAAFGTDGALALPDLAPQPQRLDGGPVYMASGGAHWKVMAGAGATMYLVEFLRGVHRVDRGKVEPVCPGLQGVGSIAVRGKTSYASGDKVTLGGKCARTRTELAPPPSRVVVVGDDLWGETQGFEVVRYAADGTAAVTVGTGDAFEPGGICSVSGLAPCGDGVCVADGNCMKVTHFAHDGSVVAVYEDDRLFVTRPYGLSGAAAAPDGSLWIAATHKDGNRCEGALYRVASP
jgi:hypothetical protein